MTPYAELHARSGFSFGRGASTPEAMVAEGARLGLHALALTDFNDMGGVVRHAEEGRRLGVEAIVGAEVTIAGAGDVVLLAASRAGYNRLSHLVTLSRMGTLEAIRAGEDGVRQRGEPAVTWEQLLGSAIDVHCLTGGPRGPLSCDDEVSARRSLGRLKEAFGERLSVEIGNHGIREEALAAARLVRMARQASVHIAATQDAYHATRGQHVVADVVACIRHHVTLEEAGTRLLPGPEWHLKSGAEMSQLFSEIPEAIERTVEIAEACTFRLENLRPALPRFATPDGIPEIDYLERLAREGIVTRGVDDSRYSKQLDRELRLVRDKGLAGYFLIMWDAVRFAESEGILCQGRGSAANSVLCWALGITQVDPIRYDLLFERFLSEERDGYPDIDVDFSHRERERVLQYVFGKYGRGHGGMVCETIEYRAKAAIRATAKSLGFDFEEEGRLAAAGGAFDAPEDAAKALENGGLAEAGFDPTDHRCQALVDVVGRMQGLPRQRGTHVGGFAFTGEPLSECVPIEPAAMLDRTVMQWDKDDLEPAGLVKFDFLGLGMLTLLQDQLTLLRLTRGVSYGLYSIPPDDRETYDAVCEADTVGVFQIESRAQMNTLPRLRPRNFYDLAIEVALIRPGPLQGNMVHPYLDRRRGKAPVEYLDERLVPALQRTLGIPLFQEQGMKVAVAAAGFTPVEAEKLRRAMSSKRKSGMGEMSERLRAGMRTRGIAGETAEQIIRQLEGFASFGFPESHATSFALLVYASAYLRVHYPPEFTACLLNAQPMGFYSPATIVQDAKRHGVEVRGPDLLRSDWDCTLELRDGCDPRADRTAYALRIGLRYVDGLGKDAREKIYAARPFDSVGDVCRRSGLNQRALERLARAGAFESLYAADRRQTLWQVARHAALRQAPLFSGLETSEPDAPLRPMTPVEKTTDDYRVLGLSPDSHPLSHLRKWLRARRILRSDALRTHPDRLRVKTAGLVVARQRPPTAKGFCFLTLEDEAGFVNVIVRPKIFEREKRTIVSNVFLVVTGEIQREDGVVNFQAESFSPLRPTAGADSVRSRDFR